MIACFLLGAPASLRDRFGFGPFLACFWPTVVEIPHMRAHITCLRSFILRNFCITVAYLQFVSETFWILNHTRMVSTHHLGTQEHVPRNTGDRSSPLPSFLRRDSGHLKSWAPIYPNTNWTALRFRPTTATWRFQWNGGRSRRRPGRRRSWPGAGPPPWRSRWPGRRAWPDRSSARRSSSGSGCSSGTLGRLGERTHCSLSLLIDALFSIQIEYHDMKGLTLYWQVCAWVAL